MNIIPYKSGFVQAKITPTTHKTQTNYKFDAFLGKSRVQSSAYDLYDLGLNVVPQPIGKKGGYPWKRLQYTRLSRDDKNFGLNTLFAGECNLAVVCGATSRNLFIIDCETVDTLKYHINQLEKRNIPLWVVKTARGGHIYLRAAEGAVHNVSPNVMSDAEVKGQNGYVLAPPSLHPSGVQYTWMIREGDEIPVISIDNVNWLYDKNGERIYLTADTTSQNHIKGNWSYQPVSPCSNLSNATRHYIEEGHTIPSGSRNNELFKAACDMNGNGYSQDEAESTLIPVAIGSGLSIHEITATINSAYSRNRTPSRPEQKTNIEDQSEKLLWRYALLWATHQQWQGRRSSSYRALSLALIERCRLSANENGIFRASIRELAELARLGTRTVQSVLDNLIQLHVIQKCGQDARSGASLWRFTSSIIKVGKKIELKRNTVRVSPHWLRFSVFLFNSDTSERGALGHSVMFVYQFMNTVAKPMMPSEIATELGLSVNQVNYALRKMCKFGLLQRHDEGWLPIDMSPQEFEDTILDGTDIRGKGQRRQALFQRERRLFAGRLVHDRRLKVENDAFARPVILQSRCEDLLDDPLLVEGLVLGAAIEMDDGSYLIAER